MTKTTEPTIEAQIREIHERLHGRLFTHQEVAKHARWTPEELEGVCRQDEYLFYDELEALIDAEIAKVLDRAKQRFHEPIEHDGSYISISVIDKTFDELIQAERALIEKRMM